MAKRSYLSGASGASTARGGSPPRRKSLAERPNQRWALDFVSDTLATGQTFRVLTVIDEYTRESLVMEVDTSLPALRVVRVLEQLGAGRGWPEEIRVGHGPEFVS